MRDEVDEPLKVPETIELTSHCESLGNLLGLDGPAPLDVLIAAVEDPTYAHNLLAARRERRYLDRLVHHPPAPKSTPIRLSELARNATTSLARWAATGFSTVDDQQFATRIAACLQCPNLTVPDASRRMLYAAISGSFHEGSICAKCGCLIKAKARRTSDTCPDADPSRVNLNRWGEPILRGMNPNA